MLGIWSIMLIREQILKSSTSGLQEFKGGYFRESEKVIGLPFNCLLRFARVDLNFIYQCI